MPLAQVCIKIMISMGRGRNEQVVTQSRKEIKRLEPRKGEVTYDFYNFKQKKSKTEQVSENFVEQLKNRPRIIDYFAFVGEISSLA